MYHTSGWSLSLVAFIYLMLPGDVSLTRNYPSEHNTPKPCVRINNTVIYQGVICEWDEIGRQYTDESTKNCENSLKAECPECNKANCEKCGNRHCCHLRYKARGYTWLDLFYANQYGPSDYDEPVYDIIEIRREIHKHQDFGGRDQQDWPNNVIDSKGERGLKWIDVKPLKRPIMPDDLTEMFLCHKENDNRCVLNIDSNGTIFHYVKKNYPNGFDPDHHVIEKSPLENDTNAKIMTYYNASCTYILIDRIRYPACRVLYTRYGIPQNINDNPITKFVYMEAQFYNIPTNSPNLSARYGYWSMESPLWRDQIFADKFHLPPGGQK